MKILIQHLETGLYYSNLGTWTDEMDNAITFGSLTEASAYGKQEGLQRFQMILQSADDGRILGCIWPESEAEDI